MPHNRSDTTKIKPEKAKRARKAPKKITKSYLHNSGLYYLERFSASSEHFKSVMRRKIKRSCMHHTDQDYDTCVELLEKTVERFIEIGLLNDTVYAQSLVNRLRRQGLSRSAILTKARIKGVDTNLAADIIAEHDETEHVSSTHAEKQAALRLARKKKIGPFARTEETPEDEKKSLGKLARAGFSYDIARFVLDFPREKIDPYSGHVDIESID